MDKYNTLKDKKDFDSFILAIPEYHRVIAASINKPILTLSNDETIVVCDQFLKIFKEGLFDLYEKKKLISYIGGAFIQRYGGEWFFTGLKKDSFAVNEPVIMKYKREALRYSPSEAISRLFETNDPNYFNWSNKSMEEFDEKTDRVFSELFGKKKQK